MQHAILDVTVLFTLALALSLVVERALEVLKASYDMLDSRYDWYHAWTRRAERTAHLLERRMRVFERVDPALAAAALRRFDEMLLARTAAPTSVPVLSADALRVVWVRIGVKTVAVVLGVLAALALDLDLLAALPESDRRLVSWLGPNGQHTVGLLLTGTAIGMGSGPLHKLIAGLERRRKEAARV